MADLKNYLLGDYRDTVDYINRLERNGLYKFPPLIISCAITGGAHGAESNPNLPETPEAQVEAAYSAYNAGASIVHIHRRSPENLSRATQKAEEYLEVNSMIRARCPDLIINNTCIGGREVDIGKSVISDNLCVSLPARPEVASIDLTCRSVAFKLPARKPPLTGRDVSGSFKLNYLMDMDEAETIIKLMDQYGTKPELELFGLNDIKYVHELVRRNAIRPPYWVQTIFGTGGANPTADDLVGLSRLLPKESLPSIIGIGACQTAIITISMILGYHIRVGLEDNIFYAPGELATSNAQLVERAVRIALELGRPIATPSQAREMMGLGAPRQYDYNK